MVRVAAEYRLVTPGTRITWNETEAVNIPTCPGCARSDWPGARSYLTTSPASSAQARPWPPMRWSTNPSPAKIPAEKDCWNPAEIWIPGVPARNPCRCTRYSSCGPTSMPRMLPGSFAANAMVPALSVAV